MATLTCTITLQYNQRGLTSSQLVSIFTLLNQMQTAGTTAKYAVNVYMSSYNDDVGSMQATVIVTASKTGQFAAADIQTILAWVTTNVTNVLPADVTVIKNYTWIPTP